MFSQDKSLVFPAGGILAGVRLGFVAVFVICLLSITYPQERGALISADSRVTVWWTEGVSKVMKQDLPPKARSVEVRLCCARNEYEPFILVFRPKIRLAPISPLGLYSMKVQVKGLPWSGR